MTWFWVLDVVCLLWVLAGAVLVVWLRNLSGAVMALSLTGMGMTVLFVVLGAPDVAHAEVVVGSIALPVLYLVAIGKCRTVVERDDESTGKDRELHGREPCTDGGRRRCCRRGCSPGSSWRSPACRTRPQSCRPWHAGR